METLSGEIDKRLAWRTNYEVTNSASQITK